MRKSIFAVALTFAFLTAGTVVAQELPASVEQSPDLVAAQTAAEEEPQAATPQNQDPKSLPPPAGDPQPAPADGQVFPSGAIFRSTTWGSSLFFGVPAPEKPVWKTPLFKIEPLQVHSTIRPRPLLDWRRDWYDADPSFMQPFVQRFEVSFMPKSERKKKIGFHWDQAMKEYMIFTTAEHVHRSATQEKTYSELGGPFMRDWLTSIKGLGQNRWGDGDGPFTNYLGHPMNGAIYAFIYKQNDDNFRPVEFDLKSPQYRKGIFKALAFSAIASLQFEVGPYSEATIGNVGKVVKNGNTGAGYVDLVMTPVGGAAIMLGEDALDRYLIKSWENNMGTTGRRIIRVALNPMRSVGNLLRIKAPWHRDTR